MKTILYFCPHWGNKLPFKKFCSNVKKAGYDGIEMDLPLEKNARSEIVKIINDHGLLLIGQYWQSLEKNYNSNVKNFKKHLDNLINADPFKINTQTGKDYFSFEQNMKLIDIAQQMEDASGIQICHETHRGKFLFSLQTFNRAYEENPDIHITLDASHWCTVHESLLDDQQHEMKKALKATRHIHSRVGFQEGPQINDPRAPEWKEVIDRHFTWWDVIVKIHAKKRIPLTVTAEFGPEPYMPLSPYVRKPLADQWAINLHMVTLFKKRYDQNFR